jgi:predicted TIM-barrel fold metal-dependent hydrolase
MKKSTIITDDQILNMDLDNANLDELLQNVTQETKTVRGSKESLYRNSPEDATEKKSYRSKMRRKIKSFVKNGIYLAQQKNKKELQALIVEFNKFYKAEFILNDYSVGSVCAKHTDLERQGRIKLFLQIVKKTPKARAPRKKTTAAKKK